MHSITLCVVRVKQVAVGAQTGAWGEREGKEGRNSGPLDDWVKLCMQNDYIARLCTFCMFYVILSHFLQFKNYFQFSNSTSGLVS